MVKILSQFQWSWHSCILVICLTCLVLIQRPNTKMRRLRTWRLSLLLLKVALVSAQISSKESLNAIDDISGSDSFGLTAYGEPCSDECKPRGFPYTWCHKTPSRNGTWIDRDYCSPAPGVTRYLEPCLDACTQRDQPFYWCRTRRTKRGDWDYCSPFGTAGALCSWSSWGTWSQCSPDCGPKSSRTRRRRFETESGNVGPCSGEIEQSISQCTNVAECSGKKMFMHIFFTYFYMI